jgi:hypothetical protein
MFSPRYWVLTVVALVLGATSRRGAVLWRGLPRVFSGVTLVAAVLPLGIGLHLPFPNYPRLTFDFPTTFPTADGHQPMGGLVEFLHRLKTAPHHVIDHNQATWLAARDARYATDSSGQVPVLDFSLRSSVQLACALQGATPRIVSIDAPFFYTDERDLLRTYHLSDRFLPASRRDLALEFGVEPAGPEIAGARLVHARRDATPDLAWRERVALAALFGGNTFVTRTTLDAGAAVPLSHGDAGKTLVLFAEAPFSVAVGDGAEIAAIREGPWFFVRLCGREWFERAMRLTAGRATFAVSTHPDYMAADQLR